MHDDDLLVMRPPGLYCPAGDFYIDPMRPVARAVITHGHADHARRGHGAYLTATRGVALLRQRLGAIQVQGLAYGEPLTLGGVRLSLHPAGHVLGSAQVRLEAGGRVWVATGDYFLSAHDGDRNPTCEAFEPVRCDCFVTESTFALPLYRWRPQHETLAEISAWWREVAAAGGTALLLGYSLGKAQHLLAGLEPGIGPIFVHPTVQAINQIYRAEGVALPATQVLQADTGRAALRGALVLAPPGVQQGPWAAALQGAATAQASGWMQLQRQRRARAAAGRGFVLSDHADWPGLLRAIAASAAPRIIVTHGEPRALVRWLVEQGQQAHTFEAPVAPGTAHPAAPSGGY